MPRKKQKLESTSQVPTCMFQTAANSKAIGGTSVSSASGTGSTNFGSLAAQASSSTSGQFGAKGASQSSLSKPAASSRSPETSTGSGGFDVKSLPNEVWCIIFSYLDKKSLRNLTATCTYWFELIRNNSKFSGHICLPNDHLLELKRKIDDSQWIWTRWPVLQTLEFGRCFLREEFRGFYSNESYTPAIGTKVLQKVANCLSQSVNFKDSPGLDKIICFVTWHLKEIFPYLPRLPWNFGLIHALTINPKNKIELVGIEHVSHLKLSIEDKKFSSINRLDHTFYRDIAQSMKMIGENGRNLKRLIISFPEVRWTLYSELFGFLGNAFDDMFKGLKNFNSLQIVVLNLAVVENFEKFPNTFFSSSGAMVTHLNVRHMTCGGITLSEINHRFPNLKHFSATNANKDINTTIEDLPKLVEDIFPDKTKVEIEVWTSSHRNILSKIPFHKCVTTVKTFNGRIICCK